MQRLFTMLAVISIVSFVASVSVADGTCKYVRQQSQIISSTSAMNAPAGDAGSNTPGGGYITSTGQLQARSSVTFCVPNIASQPTGVVIKVRCDNGIAGTPTDGGSDPSYALVAGNCVPCYVPSSFVPTAISSLDGGQLNTTECVLQ